MPDDPKQPDADMTPDDPNQDARDETCAPRHDEVHSDFEMPTVPGMDKDAPGSMASVPKQIGPYRITGVIGFGGMGAVYEAIQESPSGGWPSR